MRFRRRKPNDVVINVTAVDPAAAAEGVKKAIADMKDRTGFRAAESFQMPYAFYPHYWSTYCIHHRHTECRLTCKHCEAPCLCVCHETAPPPNPETGPDPQPDREAVNP